MPKLKINTIILTNDFNPKHYFLSKENKLKNKFYWNKPGEIEIVALDYLFSSNFSNKTEYNKVSAYYRSIIESNKDELIKTNIPIIFMGSAFDIAKKMSKKPWDNFPSGKIFIPKTLLISKNGKQKLYEITTPNKKSISTNKESTYKEDKDLDLKLISETSERKFKNMVNKAKGLINNKEILKIVLSRHKEYQINSSDGILCSLLKNADKKYPSCTNFIYDFQDKGIFFGITPEKLFTLSNNEIKTVAIAGTFKSSDNPNKNSSKELKEHQYVIDYLKNVLTELSENITIEKKPKVIVLNQIAHLKTKIKAIVNQKIDTFDILYKIHPTPAVAGDSKKKSIKLISNIEGHERGWYSGFSGWIDSKGNSDFVVSIRSGIIKNNTLSIYAGCGITDDSDPKKEYIESELKFNYILSILKNE